MKIKSYLSKEIVENLKKLIGGELMAIYTERGKIRYGDNLEINGSGMISIIVRNHEQKEYFKLRLRFHKEKEDIFYTEFYEWNYEFARERAKLRRKNISNFDKEIVEDYEKYSISIQLNRKKENWDNRRLAAIIKTIKIYQFEGIFDNGWECDYVGLIEIETGTGRKIIIEYDDQLYHFYLHIDNSELLNFRLSEIHDDSGETFGKKRYQLKHEIN